MGNIPIAEAQRLWAIGPNEFHMSDNNDLIESGQWSQQAIAYHSSGKQLFETYIAANAAVPAGMYGSEDTELLKLVQ